MPALSTTVRDALFAHWSVPPSLVAARLPESLAVDTHEGEAYVGVVTFETADAGPPFVPFGDGFPQVNVRTYVTEGDRSGVYFFTLDADDVLGVGLARALFRLPYRNARATLVRRGRETRFRSRRDDAGDPATVDARYEPEGSPFRPDSGSLAAFLTERYRYYTASDAGDPGKPRGRVYHGTIEHEPWTLWRADATVDADGMFEACGFESPAGDPHTLYARQMTIRANRPRRL